MGSAAPYVNLLCWHNSKPVTTPDWSTNWCSVSFTISQNVIHLSPYKKGDNFGLRKIQKKKINLHIFISYFMHSKTFIFHSFYTHINYFSGTQKIIKKHTFLSEWQRILTIIILLVFFCKYSSFVTYHRHKCLKCLKNAVLKHE